MKEYMNKIINSTSIYWVLTVLGTALYTGKSAMNKRQDFCSFEAHVLLAGDGKGKALK